MKIHDKTLLEISQEGYKLVGRIEGIMELKDKLYDNLELTKEQKPQLMAICEFYLDIERTRHKTLKDDIEKFIGGSK